jgi:hypothetical protein
MLAGAQGLAVKAKARKWNGLLFQVPGCGFALGRPGQKKPPESCHSGRAGQTELVGPASACQAAKATRDASGTMQASGGLHTHHHGPGPGEPGSAREGRVINPAVPSQARLSQLLLPTLPHQATLSFLSLGSLPVLPFLLVLLHSTFTLPFNSCRACSARPAPFCLFT